MKIKPLNTQVLLKEIIKKEELIGGIYIPENSQIKESHQMEIVGVGDKVESAIKVGDIALVPRYGGSEIKVDGVKYIILRDEDILGIVEK